MLKVFLVEDEVVVREGIKNNIDWAEHGYEFCGDASDGELAFPMIQKCKPDILITDIKMPFMDGITLSKLVKKEMPEIEIILLTGYEEFEYAKEGIKIGVAEYLSKPISGNELLREVDIIAKKIEEKRQEQNVQERYAREMQENTENEKKELFRYLVTGGKTVVELLEMAGGMEIDLSALWYNIVMIRPRVMNRTQEEYSNSIVKIDVEIKKYVQEEKVLGFEGHLEGKYILLKADTEEALRELQKRFVENVKGVFDKYENVSYFGGIGVPVNRLTEIPKSYEQANRALAHQYLLNESTFIDSAEIGQEVGTKEEFDIRHVDPKQINSGKIKDFLKLGDREEVVYFVEAFFEGLGNGALNSKMFLQYVTMDAYFSVADFVDSLQKDRDEIEVVDISSDVFKSPDTALQYIIRIIDKALELRDASASNRYGNVANEVMHYIEQHYAEDELSLHVLATVVNFSPNHLSAIFSQQTGQTIIKYLTDYRMNKAKELLRCTGKKSSEISVEVGYKDPHYFSYLFKKTQGMTPTQYRSGKGVEGEE